MSDNTKRCFKVFWAWQEDREAHWLEQMALKGWSLKSVRGIKYTFERSAPQKMVYRLDFKESFAVDFEEYLQLYRDAGWEYVTRLGNWYYFRRPADAATGIEFYTDNASRLARYRAQLRVMLLAGLPMLIFCVVLYPLMTRSLGGWWVRALQLLVLSTALIYGTAVGRILSIIRQIELDPKE